MGVGALSMLVPMFNAELAPPGIRGSLVALQQLAITCESYFEFSQSPHAALASSEFVRRGALGDLVPPFSYLAYPSRTVH